MAESKCKVSRLCGLIMLFGLAGAVRPCAARVLCPRVLSEHTADVTDLGRFRRFQAWKNKTGNELALAIWRYLCDYETGLYHFHEILEGPDPFDEYATVRDPIKILNVYNMGYCGIFGPVLDGIYQGVGFEAGRAFGVSRWNHCTTEVWYEGKWHYLDLDVRGALLDENGCVVSVDEARRRRGLWVNPPRPVSPFFPKDNDKNKLFEIYRDSRIDYDYRWFEGSHTMDFYLRRGETFTRFWHGQGGRWHHLPRYNRIKELKQLIQQNPVGAKPNHRDFSCWNHGNGLFRYEPNLTESSSDFYDGVYAANNIGPGKRGLEIQSDGKAQAVFEIFSPYIIVAGINDLDDENDDAEAGIVTLETPIPVELVVSLDHGLSWASAGRTRPGQTSTIDLTRLVKGTYGYLLKLVAHGNKGTTIVRTLRIDTWVQVAPISLPRLKKGTNHLRYELGDRYGLSTIPVLVKPDTADPNDLEKYLLALPEDYDPKRHTTRIRGQAILQRSAPPDGKIAWFTAGATFRTHQGLAAEQTDNRISYALEEPGDFKEIYKAGVPTWVNHWRYNWDTDVRLDKPVEKVYIKYTGNPAVNVIRACFHIMPARPAQQHIRIVHGFKTANRLVRKVIDLDRPDDYTITCTEDPENIFIEMSVPSMLKP